MSNFDKKIINRAKTIKGHMGAVEEMITNGEDCEKILLQISAIRGSLDKLGKKILLDHLNYCVCDSIEEGNGEIAMHKLNEVLDKYL